MNKNDFHFDKYDEKYVDYWFSVFGESREQLTKRYMEQSMIGVYSVVFSLKENLFGIKKTFPFNYTVNTFNEDDDKELYGLLKELVEENKQSD